MKIRSDLEGVVFVHVPGDVVMLSAGDVVPDGAAIDSDLIEKEASSAGKPRGRRSSPRQDADG